jgi:hypothetical protein
VYLGFLAPGASDHNGRPEQKFWIEKHHNHIQKFLSFGDKSILVYHTGQKFENEISFT